MKKIIFLLFCFFCFFSCTDLDVEDDGDPRGKNRRRDREDSKKEKEKGEYGATDVCEGADYTLYLDECPEEGDGIGPGIGADGFRPGGRSSDSDGFAGALPESKKPMDILFVLDTSHSMSSYYNSKFRKRFRTFITSLNRIDWRMFFTNAGYSSSGWFLSSAMNGKAMKLENSSGKMDIQVLDRFLPGYSNIFHWTLTREPDRSSEHEHSHSNRCQYPPYCNGGEEPLHALEAGFSANKHLTREEADFVAIIITNTDANPTEGESTVTADTIFKEFKKVYGSDKRLYVLSIIVMPGDAECVKENDDLQFLFKETNEGKQIAEVAKKIGGGNFSICLKDYSIVADTIVRLSTQ